MLARIHSFVGGGIDAVASEVEAELSPYGPGKVTILSTSYPHLVSCPVNLHLLAIQLSELSQVLRIFLLVALQIFCIMVLCFFALNWNAKREERTRELVSKFLVTRHWDPVEIIPDHALAAIRQASFLIHAPGWDNYKCVHAFKAHSASLYFGLIRQGGARSYRKNTPVILTDELRTPLECLIVHQAKGDQFRTRFAIPTQGINSSFVACFKEDPRTNKALLESTLRIVEMVFSNVVGAFLSGATAVIGPSGLVLTGRAPVTVKNLDQSLATLVRDSHALLDYYSEIISENCKIQDSTDDDGGNSDILGDMPLPR